MGKKTKIKVKVLKFFEKWIKTMDSLFRKAYIQTKIL